MLILASPRFLLRWLFSFLVLSSTLQTLALLLRFQRKLSETGLRMLIKKIIITERKGKLKIKIQLNADFSTHIDFLHDEDDPMYKSHGDILVVEK